MWNVKETMHGRFLLILLFILSAPLLSNGQTYSDYTWYIGNRIVEFNRSTTVPVPANGVPLVGTAAVVADPANGDVLFYTDGQTIYDASNQPMPNGSGLTADPAGNQHVVVAAVPGSTTKYYVITNSATGEIRMTIVDMSLAGNTSAIPLGNVGPTKNVLVAPGLVN